MKKKEIEKKVFGYQEALYFFQFFQKQNHH